MLYRTSIKNNEGMLIDDVLLVIRRVHKSGKVHITLEAPEEVSLIKLNEEECFEEDEARHFKNKKPLYT